MSFPLKTKLYLLSIASKNNTYKIAAISSLKEGGGAKANLQLILKLFFEPHLVPRALKGPPLPSQTLGYQFFIKFRSLYKI